MGALQVTFSCSIDLINDQNIFVDKVLDELEFGFIN